MCKLPEPFDLLRACGHLHFRRPIVTHRLGSCERPHASNQRPMIKIRGANMVVAHWYCHLMITEPDAYLTEKHFSNDAINTRDAELACVHAHLEGAAESVDIRKKCSANSQCLRRLASICLRCVSKCVIKATIQHLLQFFSLLVSLPTNTCYT